MSELVPFISRDDLSDRLGRDVTASDNARIAVDSACDIVRTFTEQAINYVADETITLDGTDTDILVLPELPVTEVSSVIADDEDVSDFTLHDSGALIGSTPWLLGRNNVEVTYSHGWSEVPSSLRIVALNIAERLFTTGGGGGVSSETIGSYSVSYDVGSVGMTDFEVKVLAKFKRAKQPWATVLAS